MAKLNPSECSFTYSLRYGINIGSFWSFLSFFIEFSPYILNFVYIYIYIQKKSCLPLNIYIYIYIYICLPLITAFCPRNYNNLWYATIFNNFLGDSTSYSLVAHATSHLFQPKKLSLSLSLSLWGRFYLVTSRVGTAWTYRKIQVNLREIRSWTLLNVLDPPGMMNVYIYIYIYIYYPSNPTKTQDRKIIKKLPN
jgi:hypothetical protein